MKIEKLDYIKSLDGLRGLAALMVVAAHSPELNIPLLGKVLKAIPSIFYFGYLGVDIFFVMSGFLITRILLVEKRNDNLSIKTFFLKRALRILPLYYLVVITCSIIYGFKGDSIASLLYISNYYFSFNLESSPLRHTWSLSVEQHFYILWPFLIKFFPSKIKIENLFYGVIAFTIIVTIATSIFFPSDLASALIYRGTQYRMLSLVAGAVIAVHLNNEKSTYFFKRSTLIILFSSGCLIVLLRLILTKVYHLDYVEAPLASVGFSIISTAIVMLAIKIDRSKEYNKNNFLDTKFMMYLGKISYGLYLIHFVIFYACNISHDQKIESVRVDYYIAILVGVFIISHISYFFFELPVIKLKKYLH